MTKRSPCAPAPGPLEDRSHRDLEGCKTTGKLILIP